MRKFVLMVLAVCASLTPARAQSVDHALIGADQVWRVRAGDNPAWSQPTFDDSGWPKTTLAGDAATVEPGWRWYRLRVQLPAGHPPMGLLIVGPENEYQLYVNGKQIPGAAIRGPLWAYKGKEHVFPLPETGEQIEIAIRVFYPKAYTEIYGLALDSVSLGPLAQIEDQSKIVQDQRLLLALPSGAINLALVLAGIGVLLLFLLRRSALEFLWLGLYLATVGVASGIPLLAMTSASFPLSVNNFVGDPLTYPMLILEVEFAFAFTRRRVTPAWRVYEAVLLAFVACSYLTTALLIPAVPYLLAEAAVGLPAAIVLPILLMLWYWRGDRAAGWLILPTLLPAAGAILENIGFVARHMGWRQIEFLAQSVAIGSVRFNIADLADLILLLLVGAIMLLRFNRISGEQAQAQADLESARSIQQVLIPEALPEIPGFRIEAVYHPAQQVGGDFFQIIPIESGGVLAVIGDVSGKGLPAAMNVALIVGALRTLAETTSSPAEMLAGLNRRLLGRSAGFTTCLALRILPSGAATIASAGHLSPYLCGEEIAIEPGLPLGLLGDSVYADMEMSLKQNDRLTMLTDGVLEARDTRSGELFGFERTLAISSQPAVRIAEAARSFGQEDDIAVLTLQFLNGPTSAIAAV